MTWYRLIGSGPSGVERSELTLFRCADHDGPSYERDVQDRVLHRTRPQRKGAQLWLFGERSYPGGALRGLAVTTRPVRTEDFYEADIAGIGIARRHQGQGLGRKGMDTILEHLASEEPLATLLVTCDIHHDNDRAQQLCAAYGFSPVSALDNEGYRRWQVLNPHPRHD